MNIDIKANSAEINRIIIPANDPPSNCVNHCTSDVWRAAVVENSLNMNAVFSRPCPQSSYSLTMHFSLWIWIKITVFTAVCWIATCSTFSDSAAIDCVVDTNITMKKRVYLLIIIFVDILDCSRALIGSLRLDRPVTTCGLWLLVPKEQQQWQEKNQ